MNTLPNPYRSEYCQAFRPIFAVGETSSIYINFDSPINYVDFANMQLVLLRNDGSYYGVVPGAVITKDILPTGYNLYLSFVNPNLDGPFRLAIKDSVTQVILFKSNDVEFVDAASAALVTTLVKFRSSRNMFRYGYSRLPDFYNQFRLALFQRETQMEEEVTKYTEVSTGRIRLERSEINRSFKFEAYKFDEEAHEAMAVLLAHDNISFNGKKYVRKGAYEISPMDRGNLSNGTIEMYDEEFGSINKY